MRHQAARVWLEIDTLLIKRCLLKPENTGCMLMIGINHSDWKEKKYQDQMPHGIIKVIN